MEKFKVIIVEDVPLELKGTEGCRTSRATQFTRSLKKQISLLALVPAEITLS